MDMTPPPVVSEAVAASPARAAPGNPPIVQPVRDAQGGAVSDNPRSFYTGWLLDAQDRARLLERFPPRYAEVVAHHVTHTFGDRQAQLPTETSGEIVGIADDGRGVQALVVRIGGTTDRWDGSTYHITWSLAAGRRARESNDILAGKTWTPLAEPIPVKLEPRPFGE
jgi:hypothetical protein